MESDNEYEPAKPIGEDVNPKKTPNPDDLPNSPIENKVYKLNLDKDIYSLTIETFTNGNITFKLLQDNVESSVYYFKEYKFDDILPKLYLFKEQCDSISKVLKYLDVAISKNKVTLNKENKMMKIIIKKTSEIFDSEMQSILELDETAIKNEDMLKILMSNIEELKSKGIGASDNQDLQKLMKDNEEMKLKMKSLLEENEKNKKEIEQLKTTVKTLTEEKNKEKLQYEQLKLLISETKAIKKNLDMMLPPKKSNDDYFEKDPNNLKFKDLLANDQSREGLLANFAVYTGLIDGIAYLVYNNRVNFNLEVMRIRDKVYVRSLKKHTKPVSVIRYFRKNNREEYLLSCEVSGGFVIIWDIINNFNIINCIQEQSAGKIYDALILFNLNNQDYILISSAMKEPIKLFGFRDNQKYYNIFGTDENLTNYMIPWTYDNNYYIIKLYSDISIHNIFKNECYAKLHCEKSQYYCGYIYNSNYLCANDSASFCLRIWDLVNKTAIKNIKYDIERGKEIVPWNSKYTIVSGLKFICVVDIESEKVTKKIHLEKTCLGGVKKVFLNHLGECIIVSDFSSNIKLFSLE